jgi:hypothetical protein
MSSEHWGLPSLSCSVDPELSSGNRTVAAQLSRGDGTVDGGWPGEMELWMAVRQGRWNCGWQLDKGDGTVNSWTVAMKLWRQLARGDETVDGSWPGAMNLWRQLARGDGTVDGSWTGAMELWMAVGQERWNSGWQLDRGDETVDGSKYLQHLISTAPFCSCTPRRNFSSAL